MGLWQTCQDERALLLQESGSERDAKSLFGQLPCNGVLPQPSCFFRITGAPPKLPPMKGMLLAGSGSPPPPPPPPPWCCCCGTAPDPGPPSSWSGTMPGAFSAGCGGGMARL